MLYGNIFIILQLIRIYMGVKLSELAEYKNVDFSFFKNKKVGVDFSNMCYQFLSSIRSPDGTPLMNDKGDVTSHLVGITTRIPKLLSFGVKPVFVFDGEPPKLKTLERENRKKKKTEAEKKLKDAREREDLDAVLKYSKQTVRVTPEIIESSKKLLSAMGLPVIQSPSEADAQGAYLCREGKVYCVASSDFDNLLFGSPRMVSNLTLSEKRRMSSGVYVKNELKFYELVNVLKNLGISQEQLVMLGVLVGTDYNPGGVHGIGPKKALKIVKELETPEEVFEDADFDWEKIIEVFKTMKVDKKVSIEFGKPNPDSIYKLLADKFEFSEERVEKLINELEKQKDENSQRGLGEWG